MKIYGPDKEEEIVPNEFRNRYECNFKGWRCYSPQSSFNITPEGVLTTGICRSEQYGYLYDESFVASLPKSTICKRDTCSAIPDIAADKVAPVGSSLEIVKIERTEKVIFLNWDLSKKCNYDCSYCSPMFHEKGSLFFELKDYLTGWNHFLKLIDKREEPLEIFLLGGEPTLFEELESLIGLMSKSRKCRMTVMTNGSNRLFYYKQLSELCNITISVHFEFVKVSALLEKIIKLNEFMNNCEHKLLVKIMAPPGRVKIACDFRNELSPHLNSQQLEVLKVREPNINPPKFFKYTDEEHRLLNGL